MRIGVFTFMGPSPTVGLCYLGRPCFQRFYGTALTDGQWGAVGVSKGEAYGCAEPTAGLSTQQGYLLQGSSTLAVAESARACSYYSG